MLLAQPSLSESFLSPKIGSASPEPLPGRVAVGGEDRVNSFTHSGRCGPGGGSWTPAGDRFCRVGYAAVSVSLSQEVSLWHLGERTHWLGVQAEPWHYFLLVDKQTKAQRD